MRNRNTLRLLSCAVLITAFVAPLQASGQWLGPGCMVANMLGFGGVSGGMHFSGGSNGFGRGASYPGSFRPDRPLYRAPLPPVARSHGEPRQSGSPTQLTSQGPNPSRTVVTWSADNLNTGPYREVTEQPRAWNLWR